MLRIQSSLRICSHITFFSPSPSLLGGNCPKVYVHVRSLRNHLASHRIAYDAVIHQAAMASACLGVASPQARVHNSKENHSQRIERWGVFSKVL